MDDLYQYKLQTFANDYSQNQATIRAILGECHRLPVAYDANDRHDDMMVNGGVRSAR
jgi:hypothetical protein